jgi:hypothetical protein
MADVARVEDVTTDFVYVRPYGAKVCIERLRPRAADGRGSTAGGSEEVMRPVGSLDMDAPAGCARRVLPLRQHGETARAAQRAAPHGNAA